MSVCFPNDATLYGSSPETGGYGMGSGDMWDEAVWVLVPSGFVLVHRIGSSGAVIDLQPLQREPSEVAGFPADRYYLSPSDEGRQEEYLYIIERLDGVWEVRAQVKFGPDGKPLDTDALTEARKSLNEIVKTIRLQ